uniref:Uncharacterized protein n=1 Tax=Megaselia scalaris TaxID=36166 RepID=T1GUQ2_MEGSC
MYIAKRENNPLEVIQSTSADKEHELKPRKRPDTFTASQEFGLHESVVTQQADYQSPLEDRDFLKLNEEKATMKIIEKQSISLESTAVQEPINELNLPEIQSKKGTQTYLTYESSEVTENIIHETSENLKTFKPHNEEIAGIKLSTAQQAPNLQQVTLFETSTDIITQVKVVQEAARETITSSIMILDSTSEFVKSEKESTNTEFTITEGPLLATEFSQTVIDQTEDFDSEVPKIIKAENLLPEGNITTITNIIQTEENVGPLQSFEVDTKTTSISCTEGMGVALSSTEITFDESNDFITQEPNKISLKSRSIEVCKAPVQEQQMKLESECVLEKLEISLRQPRLSLSSVEKSVPLF